jgi:methylated-DNA-[protein]-cysteine S-methyltransferase
MTTHTIIDTSLGDVVLTGDEHAVTGLAFAGETPPPGRRDDAALPEPAPQVREYFAGERTAFDLSLRLDGTDFDREVWKAVAAMGYGETAT